MVNVNSNPQAVKLKIRWNEVYALCEALSSRLDERGIKKVYGIPRGGIVPATIIAEKLEAKVTDNLNEADLIVDDLIDSGSTYERYKRNDTPFAVLYGNKNFLFPGTIYSGAAKPDAWLEFPWEVNEVPAEDSVIRILQAIGEDPTREGLKETPRRFMEYLKECTGRGEFKFTTFDSEGYDEMIVQSGIPFSSLCEHHIAPFFGTATVAYIPDKKIVGLSKLARSVDYFAHGLQNQERITQQVVAMISEKLKPKGVAVILKAKHLCMETRGVKKHNTWTTTSKMTGLFMDDSKARSEFLQLI